VNSTVHVCLRRAFVWLLLLAIPFQGIASAGMLACTHAAKQHSSVTAVSAPHGMAAGADHCHDAGPQVTKATDHAPTDHDQERCSACAACCIGAAMAGAPTIPAAPQTLSTRLIEAATGRPEAVDLALPERPPRFPLA
jgi:hypothetical protein